jgi:hypothetical protein
MHLRRQIHAAQERGPVVDDPHPPVKGSGTFSLFKAGLKKATPKQVSINVAVNKTAPKRPAPNKAEAATNIIKNFPPFVTAYRPSVP